MANVSPTPPHFIVTAGSTYEPIDQVRGWGNIFTGQTGLDIALALLDLGDVTLLTSNSIHVTQYNGYSGKRGMLGAESFRTHADLLELLTERMTSGDHVEGVAMSAAVSDYAPAGSFRIHSREAGANGTETWVVENVDAPKVKSLYGEIAVRGLATMKLVDQFRSAWGYEGLLIKFKLEVGIAEEQLIAVAENSRKASSADMIIANTLEMVKGENPEAYFIDDQGVVRIARDKLAGEVASRVAKFLQK